MARIKAVLRRSSSAKQSGSKIARYEGLVVNMDNYEVRVDGKALEFTPKEVEILFLLASVESLEIHLSVIRKHCDFEPLGKSIHDRRTNSVKTS